MGRASPCLYAAGQIEAGVAAAEELVKRETARKGANSFDAAIARGLLAIGYSRSNRAADALREFKTAIPIMMTAARESADDDDPTLVAAKQARLQRIVEAYFNALVDQAKDPNDVAEETFALSDAIRGHSVGHSLADASARLAAKDPALAELVRGEQDLAKQIEASLGARQQSAVAAAGRAEGPGRQRGFGAARRTADKARRRRSRHRQALPRLRLARSTPSPPRSPTSGLRCGRARRCCRSISGGPPASSGRFPKTAPWRSRGSR